MARVNGRIRRGRPRVVEPMSSFRVIAFSTMSFLGIIAILVVFTLVRNFHGAPIKAESNFFSVADEIPDSVVSRLDVILVLGGGVPSSLDSPPVYVQRRCDDAAAVVSRHQLLPATFSKKSTKPVSSKSLPILCLSAGTAHLPQLLSANGLPIWESTSSAAYLEQKHNIQNVFVETTSYDTIGNAFYARTSHTDIVGWRKLLVVTNEFHMDRSKAIFEWIFGIDSEKRAGYELYFLSSLDGDLSEEALRARQNKEAKGLSSVRKYSTKYRTLSDVWSFLNNEHDLYKASKLVERGRSNASISLATVLEKESYGAHRNLHRNIFDRISSSIHRLVA
ncbi:predicted protein [Phaeodactylum tricornutum CCAP 1055/1]|jgi:uncharacterized SAM-binding protein YcdF (DUF218 family)|uniref:DUF218 domain-containing protein n=2 Tax=Phaeodactylum tricornutum TaxID=2850 RepID=B7G1B2_PHATC|nr:predicted protein [Phaeodactylum tricornutum CCAP 1055/1]EEC47476.1 predicted protein [Phaeodactylum tricornutum CCAP 1055/1]|eukprot:XP_002180824.1 predicted protein [Phaeodactylum tricornutum CCAP 1055/1]